MGRAPNRRPRTFRIFSAPIDQRNVVGRPISEGAILIVFYVTYSHRPKIFEKSLVSQTSTNPMAQDSSSGQTRLHLSLERARLGQGPSVGQWLELPGYSLARTVASLGEDVCRSDPINDYSGVHLLTFLSEIVGLDRYRAWQHRRQRDVPTSRRHIIFGSLADRPRARVRTLDDEARVGLRRSCSDGADVRDEGESIPNAASRQVGSTNERAYRNKQKPSYEPANTHQHAGLKVVEALARCLLLQPLARPEESTC